MSLEERIWRITPPRSKLEVVPARVPPGRKRSKGAGSGRERYPGVRMRVSLGAGALHGGLGCTSTSGEEEEG